MGLVIAMLNQKGGVGKTTSAINIGAGLAARGKKVLLVDLDAQGNLSASLDIPVHELENTVYECLRDMCAAGDAIQRLEKLDVLPSDIRLSGADLELSAIAGREMLLKEKLEPVRGAYDYILLDCSPSLSLIPLNGLVACDQVYIPLQAEFLALHGMSQLLSTMDVVKRRLNPGISIGGIIITMYDKRKNLNNEVLRKIQEYFPGKVFETPIRNSVALAEAPSYGQDIFSYKPEGHGARDYAALCEEILKKEGAGA